MAVYPNDFKKNGPPVRMDGTTAATFAAGNDSRLSDSRAPTGTAGGDLGGTYPNPTVVGIHTGATGLTIGTINDGEFVKRVGTTIVSAAAGATSPGGSGGELQWNNSGSFGAVAGSSWDSGTGTFSFAANIFVLTGGSAYVSLYTAAGVPYSLLQAPLGEVQLGDTEGNGNGSFVKVKDSELKSETNVDFEFTTDAVGPVLIDRNDATKYRLKIESGELGIEAV